MQRRERIAALSAR